MTDPRRGDGQRPLVVMNAVPFVRPTTNPFLSQLLAAIPGDGVTTVPFSWRRVAAGRFDVLHLHWPENLLDGRPGPARTWWRRLRLLLLLARLGLTRSVLVRTIHNVATHEARAPVDRWLLGRLDARTAMWIRLNPHTPVPGARSRQEPASRVIVHGHYRDVVPADAAVDASPDSTTLASVAAEPVNLLTFGLLRRYKGIEHLVEEFAAVPGHGLRLRVMGKAADPELEAELIALAGADHRVELALGYASDAALAASIRAAELVVLPYRAMHNSGALLLALSLDRPVLVPENPVTADLAREVGAGWVRAYAGPLTSDVLAAAVADLRDGPPTGRPDLSARDWPAIGAQHRDAYRHAADPRHHRSGRTP
ncbi:glycosyltransferase [Marisediminicola senii]|uniref:glycosyltransferase n=1 Tax=Marisediminicola senii TaxID=2711233 RepID=UPI0013EB8970|nr:glycosyltransferase [Marisediminicola senii]